MSILENNVNAAFTAMAEKIESEKKDGTIQQGFVIVQLAHNKESFQLYSIALTSSKDDNISEDIQNDRYYNMFFVAKNADEIMEKFRNKYLFKLAYADIHCAIYTAYQNILRSETGEYNLNTSFYKPSIKDMAWAYNDAFEFSDFGQFRCWFDYDPEYKQVNIQTDQDFIVKYDELYSGM